MRTLATGAGMFVVVLAVLLAAVGQLGRIDGQTLVAVLACSGIAGAVAAWRTRHRA